MSFAIRELSPDRFEGLLAMNQNGPDIAGRRGRSLPTLEVVRVDKRDRPSNESTARPVLQPVSGSDGLWRVY